jgi:hypothetical protein
VRKRQFVTHNQMAEQCFPQNERVEGISRPFAANYSLAEWAFRQRMKSAKNKEE